MEEMSFLRFIDLMEKLIEKYATQILQEEVSDAKETK